MTKNKQSLVTVIALRDIEHNGVLYGPEQEAGDEFELTEGQAAPLRKLGAVQDKAEPEPSTDSSAPAGKTSAKK